MAFFVLGVLLLVLKLAGFPGIALMSWWWVVAPFVLAVVWWQVADVLGITQAQAMRRVEERAEQRRKAQRLNLGLGSRAASSDHPPRQPRR